MAHTGPGDPLRARIRARARRPACGNESSTAVYSEDPRQMAGCADCLELVAEAPKNLDWYRGYCVNCMQEISAQGGLAWRRIVREPCPYCSRAGW